MELFIFARFHACAGREDEVAAALAQQVEITRLEPGCREIRAFRSIRDSRQFFIHARWADEAAFDAHAELPGTRQFIARMEALMDHAFDATRTQAIA